MEKELLDIVQLTHTFYNDALNRILWILGVFVVIVGAVIPGLVAVP